MTLVHRGESFNENGYIDKNVAELGSAVLPGLE